MAGTMAGRQLPCQREKNVGSAVKFWNLFAERYARQPIADEAAYQKKLEVTRGYLRADMQVLEMGCGTGATALAHAPHVRHIRGIDASPRMIEIAQRKAAAQNVGNASFECLDVAALEVPAASVDAVLALSILHLMADWQQVISRVHRMLKPGGIFVTSTTCVGDGPAIQKWVLPPLAWLGLPQVQLFTAAQLVAAQQAAGFDIAHQWQPKPGAALFVVGTKPSGAG